MGIARKLEDVHQGLALLAEHGKVAGFLANTENAQRIDDLVEDVRQVMMDYQIFSSNKSATAKLLRGVRDSVNAFGPLKAIAGKLCLILENCEVWPPSTHSIHNAYRLFKQTEVDEQAIESLAPRVKALSESLCAPIPLGDVNEKERERKLNSEPTLSGLRAEPDIWGLLGNWKIFIRV
jgi:hypothetical protein